MKKANDDKSVGPDEADAAPDGEAAAAAESSGLVSTSDCHAMTKNMATTLANATDQIEPGASSFGSEAEPIGYCMPPKAHQWRKGQSGNAKGRPKGTRNRKKSVEKIAKLKVKDLPASNSDLTVFEANVLAHAINGAEGDARASRLFFDVLREFDIMHDDENNVMADPAHGPLGLMPAMNIHPGQTIFANLDRELLSRNDLIDLSRLADIIDLGGDATALSIADFTLLKNITEKARGKNVTPSA